MRYINQKNARQYALDYAARNRAQGFERVSGAFLERINAATAAAIRREIDIHPSVGKTLK